MKNNALLTFTSYAFFFLVGYFINIGGAVTNSLAQSLLVETATIGYCFSAFMIGRFIGITGNGILMKKAWVDKKIYIRVAPAVTLAAIAGLALTGNAAFLALVLFVAGIGIGLMYSISNMILVDIYSGKQKAFHITMINFIYSAGGVSSPIIAGFILKHGFAWKYPYLLYALLVLAVLLMTIPAHYSVLYTEKKEEARNTGKMNPALWLICASIVLYILAEFSITYWMPVYMRETLGKDALFAGATVSAFWIAVLIGRFIAGIAIQRISPRIYVLASGVLAIVALLSLRALESETPVLAASFFSGLFCAGLFPSIFTLGTDMSESLKRTFPTLMMLSAATGSFLAMPAGSLVKKLVGVSQMLLIPAIAIALMCVLIVLSAIAARERKA